MQSTEPPRMIHFTPHQLTTETRSMPAIVSNMIQAHVFRKSMDGAWEFLLLQRADDEPVFPLMWQVVTGYQLDGESAKETVLREIREETGLESGTLSGVPIVTSFYDPRADAVCLVPVFAFEARADAIVVLSHEHRSCEWLPYETAEARLPIPGHRDALRVLREYLLDAGPHASIFRLD
jgi:dihydroneopterin triphosphate diphosphatase